VFGAAESAMDRFLQRRRGGRNGSQAHPKQPIRAGRSVRGMGANMGKKGKQVEYASDINSG